MEKRWNASPHNKALHERNITDLTARGYSPTDFYTVIIRGHELTPVEHVVRGIVNSVAPTAFAQVVMYSDGDGELDMWPWDDGNPATYEGDVYMENFSNGASISAAWQLDISSAENHHLIYANSAYNSLVAYTACAVGGCVGGAAWCWITGPAWGWCAGLNCIRSELICALGAATSHVLNREP